MKLEDYLPEVPEMVKGLGDISNTLEWLNISKGYNDTSAFSSDGRTPTLGIETVVNGWIRNQMAYRKQLVQDIQTIAMQVEEIRAPLHHITNEVFRRGIKIVPKDETPDRDEVKRLKTFISQFECKCGNIYCTKCRYPFVHKCSINIFKNNQEKLKQDNQIIVNDKINKI